MSVKRRPGDLTPFLKPQPAVPFNFIQGVLTALDNGTGTNTVDFGGGITQSDLPIIGDSAGLAVGDIVMVLQLQARYFILGDINSGPYGGRPPYGLGILNRAKTTTNSATTAGTEVKDSNVGDISFTAVSGRRYTVSFSGRTASDANATTMDIRIRDGGAGSPTNVSTILTAGSQYVAVSGGGGQSQFTVFQTLDCPADIAAGVHTIAPFYVRTAGTGNVSLSKANNQARELKVEDSGPIRP